MQFVNSQGLIVPNNLKYQINDSNLNYLNLPKSIDWRNINNVVNPIKDQSFCGACWAFSALGSLESIYAISTGKLKVLSEQNIVDCAAPQPGYNGCRGGWMSWAFDYIKNNNGINTQSSYPYNAYSVSLF
jgi:C1A family cysteine protease